MTLPLLISLAMCASAPSGVTNVSTAPRYAIAEGKGEVVLLVRADVAVSRLTLQAGATVAEHKHESSETLVVLEGSCVLVLRGEKRLVRAGDTVHIAKGDMHAALVPLDAQTPFVAVQIYDPAGPEERFTKGKKLN